MASPAARLRCPRGRIWAVGVAIAGTLRGCAGHTGPLATPLLGQTDPSAIPVYVIYNHFHSDLIVPTAALSDVPGPTVLAVSRLSSAPWTSLGYDDSKFNQQQGINPGRVVDFVRSMLAPGNPSVVHVEGMGDALKDQGHPKIIRLSLSRTRFADLVRSVDESFALEGGQPEFVVRGREQNAKFFRGRRPASGTHECNHWIGEVLGSAGVPHTPLADTTSDGLAADLLSSGYATRVSPGASDSNLGRG